jgi:DNA replication protein DnaC
MIIWDENKKVNEYEAHLLRRACVPMYQWIEDDLKLAPNSPDIESYRRLMHIREDLVNFTTCSKNNLIICGESIGCGKTSWAFKLLLTQIENNWKKIYAEEFEITDRQFDIALFLSVPQFIVDIKQFKGTKYEETIELYSRAKETDLLVLDDIAALEMNKYDYNALYSIIEARNLSHLPTIITSNCVSKDEMSVVLGPRLADRIWANATVVELKEFSRRGI